MNLWTNRTTGHHYRVLGVVTNSTHAQDGQRMVRYQRCIPDDRTGFHRIGDEFVRDLEQFHEEYSMGLAA